ncbi:hypothetical protein EG68_06855 [Paragonimus skrjabini miyazakii]|uniref:Uncharacterized protein n=1 Tax=Paragonimus skrjabini miyazakii TaxID=59628 RepID=A0A8S9YJV9_9TREM|nr:hypothetical protein EG68_06855 [Paragonimus skrjabini miyazakii]
MSVECNPWLQVPYTKSCGSFREDWYSSVLADCRYGFVQKYHLEMPKDPITILRTPRSFIQKPVGGGVYIHFGIETASRNLLKRELVDTLELQLHIDGLSPSNGQVYRFDLSSIDV